MARPSAFLFGWSMLLVIQTGTIAAVAVAFANFMGVLTAARVRDNVPHRADRVRALRRQPLDAATGRGRNDSPADGDEHARAQARAS